MYKRKRTESGSMDPLAILVAANLKVQSLKTVILEHPNSQDYIASALNILKDNNALTFTNCKLLSQLLPCYQERVAQGIVLLKQNHILNATTRKLICNRFGDVVTNELIRLHRADLLNHANLSLIEAYPHLAAIDCAKLIILLHKVYPQDYYAHASNLLEKLSKHELIDLIEGLAKLEKSDALSAENVSFLIKLIPTNHHGALIRVAGAMARLAQSHILDTDTLHLLKQVNLLYVWELCDMIMHIAKAGCYNADTKYALDLACHVNITQTGVYVARRNLIDCLSHPFFKHLIDTEDKTLLCGLSLGLARDCVKLINWLERLQERDLLTPKTFSTITENAIKEASGEACYKNCTLRMVQINVNHISTEAELLEKIQQVEKLTTPLQANDVIAKNYRTAGMFGQSQNSPALETPPEPALSTSCTII